MRRTLTAVVVALAAIPLVAATALASPFPARIDLPNGWQPEGIAAGRGTTAYVGSLADGGIARVNLRTGAVDPDYVESATGPAVGLEYEAGADRLWVAGGPSGEVRVYSASSGDLLDTYSFGAGFINDLVATDNAIYATDSFLPQLLVIPLGAGGSLPDPADAYSLDITGDFVYGDGFNANGIVEFDGRLIVPNSTTGELFAIDPVTGDSVQLLPEGSVFAADGLELVGSTLYIVRNQFNLVDAYRIQRGALHFLRTISSADLDNPADFDFPTTVAFVGGHLWAANARFSTPPTADTPYWITRLPTR
jgi:hypothetical protein